MSNNNKSRIKFILVILLAAVAFLIANPKETKVKWVDNLNQKLKFNLGPDLQGGVVLTYQADMSQVEKGQEKSALEGATDVITRRVNAYGVSEARVEPSMVGDKYRINVELPGIKDIDEAKKMIKETPFLEFKEQGEPETLSQEQLDLIQKDNEEKKIKAEEVLQKAKNGEDFGQLAKDNSEDPSNKDKGGDLDFFKKGMMVPEFEQAAFSPDLQKDQVFSEVVKTSFGFHIIKKLDERGEGDDKEVRVAHILLRTTDPMMVQQMMGSKFKSTELTGKELEKAQLVFNQQTNLPEVSLQFNDQGKDKFKEITERNVGKPVAIYLDGQIISSPVVQDAIRDGRAVINGKFSIPEAKELASRLNEGALPVPVSLISQQSVGASLGKASLDKSLHAGIVGLLMVAIFMVLCYRTAGLVAVVALVIYSLMMISIFKLSSVTPMTIFLTLSGIAGFILSIGMAVDANILIFERMREELKSGRSLGSAMDEGFKRAWPSIRDGNFSTVITCVILYIFGTGFIKGFALVLVIGIFVSMFTAIVITRILLSAVLFRWFEKHQNFLI